MLRCAGRLVLSHGPVLVAIHLVGVLAQYAATEAIGWVGAYSAIVGALLFPVIMLVRLFALVAMLLVLRDGLANLQAIAPVPVDRAARRRDFVDALLVAVLPFVVFYSARGYLRDDASAYYGRVLQVNQGLIAEEVLGGAERAGDGAAGELTFGPITIAVIVIAFVLRWAWGRYRERLPKLAALGAVYLEALWIVWSALLLSQAFAWIGEWVSTREGVVWIGQVREWLGAQVAPLAWVWDGIGWLLGEVGGVILVPLAWLAIVGVVFGQTFAAEAPPLRGRFADGARARYGRIPALLRRRLNDLWQQVTGRVRPIWRALVLMWRAGPVLIASYVLLFVAVAAAESLGGILVTRLVGPQPMAFWMSASTLVYAIVPLLIEPLRMIVVAAGYDGVIGRLRAGQGETVSRANRGSASAQTTSTTNGPDASSGTT